MRIIKLIVLFILGITLTNCNKDDDDSLNPEERTQVELTTDFLSGSLWGVESITSPNEKLPQDDISDILKTYENFRFRFSGNKMYTLNRQETDTLEIETLSMEGNALLV